MKTVTVKVPKEQTNHVLAGDVVVLTDGERHMELEAIATNGATVAFDLDEDSPELEAELLKGVNGPHAAFSQAELRGIADRVVQQHKGPRRK